MSTFCHSSKCLRGGDYSSYCQIVSGTASVCFSGIRLNPTQPWLLQRHSLRTSSSSVILNVLFQLVCAIAARKPAATVVPATVSK